MPLELHYGRGTLPLEIPEQNILAYRRPPIVSPAADNNQEVLLAAINEFGILRLSPIFAGRQVGVIIDVASRSTPHAELLAVMLPFLRSSRFVQFLIAHPLDAAGNRQIMDSLHAMIADFDFPEYEIHANDREQDEFIEVGRTARGTPVWVNERSARCDIFLAIAGMHNHECAGYTTPLQHFLPGLCSDETLRRHQALALDGRSTFGRHPWHPDSTRRHNPLADDAWEGVQMILRRRPVLALATVAEQSQLLWAKIGSLVETISAGIQQVDALTSFILPPADYLIVSPGGYPEDESLYTAQRALELTKNAIHDGGEVLLLAQCENGLGPPLMAPFYDLLTLPIPAVLNQLENADAPNSYKVYKFVQTLQRLRALYLHSSLPNETVARRHLQPCADPQALVQQWLAQNPQAQINVWDGVNRLAVYGQ